MSPDPTVDLVRATVALFIIVDPIGLVPIFSNVTGNMPDPDRAKMYRTVIYTGASLLTIFALVGQELLALFGISLPSFEMAGGLLLLLLALDILFRGERFAKPGSHEDAGIVPIAFPLLVGPGAITTLGSVVIVMLLSWIVMKQTPKNPFSTRQNRILSGSSGDGGLHSSHSNTIHHHRDTNLPLKEHRRQALGLLYILARPSRFSCLYIMKTTNAIITK